MNKVIDFLYNLNLNKDNIIVIGVSGGPDSMFLLNILNTMSNKQNFKIIVAHVNHNVRRESASEKRFLENYCKELNIAFESMKIEKYSDDNFENEARTIRYQFFNDIVKKYNADYLMTAHHGDDLIETILMRIVRGSTLKGYSGFQKIVDLDGYKLVRPLVFLTKDEIEDLCLKNNIPYVIDKSNLKDKYTRNRYRHSVLPFLKNEDPNVNDKFLKYSDKLLQASAYIQKEVDKAINKVYKNKQISIDNFNKLDIFICEQIIYKILEDIYHDDVMLVNDRHVSLIMDLINSKKVNSFIILPNNIKVVKKYDILEFTNNVYDFNSYEVELSDYVILPTGKHIERFDSLDENGNDVVRLLSTEVELPIYIRTRKHGDKIDLHGAKGHKKVKDIFIEKKINMDERDIWPIVVDSKDNILWIPGIKKSKKCKKKNEKCDIILKYY